MLRSCLAAVLALGMAAAAGQAFAGPFQDGLKAMENGDRATALRHLVPVAERGDSDAAFAVGQIYRDGTGGPIDYGRAMAWFGRAAMLGSPSGATAVGTMYADGQGAPKDLKAAAKWYRLSADKGDSAGQAGLASVLADEESGMADYVEAYVLYTLADRGAPDAPAGFRPLDRRAELARKMTPAQIAQAEARLAARR